MTASEKLKALDGQVFVDANYHEYVPWAAFPQIVAVVEAAENDEICGCCRCPTWKHRKDCPLLALEEALK